MKKVLSCVVCVLFVLTIFSVQAIAMDSRDYYPKTGTVKIFKIQKRIESEGEISVKRFFSRIEIMPTTTLRGRLVLPLNYSFHKQYENALNFKGDYEMTKYYLEKNGNLYLWALQRKGKSLIIDEEPRIYLPISLRKGAVWTVSKVRIPLIGVAKEIDVNFRFDGISPTERLAGQNYHNCVVVRGEGKTKYISNLSVQKTKNLASYQSVQVFAKNIGYIYLDIVIEVDTSIYINPHRKIDIESALKNLLSTKQKIVEIKISLMQVKTPSKHLVQK